MTAILLSLTTQAEFTAMRLLGPHTTTSSLAALPLLLSLDAIVICQPQGVLQTPIQMVVWLLALYTLLIMAHNPLYYLTPIPPTLFHAVYLAFLH